ncbi:unnamed protein product [Closterium sp. NIES-54]
MTTSYLLPRIPSQLPFHQVAAAQHWTEWEMATSYLLPAAPHCPVALSSPIILAMTPHHQVAAARHWTEWEMATSYLLPAAPPCPIALSSPIILAMTPHHQVAAARHWTEWEMATSYLLPNEDSLKRGEDDKFALASHLLLPPLQVTRAATERSGASGSGGGGGGGGKNSPSWADALWRGTLRRLASFPLAIGLLFAVAGLCAVGALR